MLTEVRCLKCMKILGDVHGYEAGGLYEWHFKEEHPREYAEIVRAWKAYLKLKMKYGAKGYIG